jgi:pyruvate dehydrogenase E2 component (dihydrolipoamide acetyltransferase)
MPIEIIVPRLGWSMEEAIFSAWLKQPGELINAGDLLFAIESDKATQEIESLDGGLLHIPENAPKPGDKVIVAQVLGYLLGDGERAPKLESGVRSQKSKMTPDIEPSPVPTAPVVHSKSETPISTPRARRVAGELHVDWTRVEGSGRGGRIREADIRQEAPNTMSTTRRVIAERMLASRQATAPVTLHTTADATELVRLRTKLKSAGNSTAIPSYNDMLAKLTAEALRDHPVLNSRWEGEQLRTLPDIHIGIAVDTEAGLIVPVIRGVTKLSLNEIAARSNDLIERARSRKLAGDELRGGTFTITSLGAFGIDAFTPIINYPECAILGVGRIVRQPVAARDAVVLRDIITLSLTFDHCAFDGAPAARFLQALARLIETPTPLT